MPLVVRLPHQDATKVGVSAEAHPEHVPRFPLHPVGPGPEVGHRGHVERAVGIERDLDPQVFAPLERAELVDHLERQFRIYFKDADRSKGITGEVLLQSLERRLDNVVFSLGFASSRAQGRQLVRHGHILVDGRKTTIPSYQVRAGQKIVLRESSRKNAQIQTALESALGRGVPDWLALDADNFTGTVQALPSREDIKLPIQEQLIVELYSR